MTGSPRPLLPIEDTAESLLQERYVLDSDAPPVSAPVRAKQPDRHFGVIDRRDGSYATMPNATLCWGLTADEAFDCLTELRGGRRAEIVRDDD